MSGDFTLEFDRDHIEIHFSLDYEITPDSQKQLWMAVGEACRKYGCRRVLAESPSRPRHNLKRGDAIRSAMQAAKASRDLRMACVFPGYEKDETAEFFIYIAYKAGARIEFFASREDAIMWLNINDERETSAETFSAG